MQGWESGMGWVRGRDSFNWIQNSKMLMNILLAETDPKFKMFKNCLNQAQGFSSTRVCGKFRFFFWGSEIPKTIYWNKTMRDCSCIFSKQFGGSRNMTNAFWGWWAFPLSPKTIKMYTCWRFGKWKVKVFDGAWLMALSPWLAAA